MEKKRLFRLGRKFKANDNLSLALHSTRVKAQIKKMSNVNVCRYLNILLIR